VIVGAAFTAGWLTVAALLCGQEQSSVEPAYPLREYDRVTGTAFPQEISRAIVADGSVWVASALYLGMMSQQDYRLYRVDAHTGRIAATTVLPHLAVQLAVGAGSIWVVGQPPTPAYKNSIQRYDAATLRPTGTLPFGELPGCKLAFGEGSLWVWDGTVTKFAGVKLGRPRDHCFVARIDPLTHRELARIPLPASLQQLVVSAGAVWGLAHDAIYRIDPQTNRLAATIPLETGAMDMAVGEGYVWVAQNNFSLVRPLRDNRLLRIDPRTNQLVNPPLQIPGGSPTVAVGRGSVWVAYNSLHPNGVIRLDPRTGDRIGEPLFWPIPKVSAGDSGVWLTAFDPFEPNAHPKIKLRAKYQGLLHRLYP